MPASVGIGAKAAWPMLDTLAGMLTLVKRVLEKAWVPMEERLPGSTMSPVSLLFSKALWPIEVSALGKVNEVRPVL